MGAFAFILDKSMSGNYDHQSKLKDIHRMFQVKAFSDCHTITINGD